MKKILVVAPHPDDETLGCGGTLLKHQSEGEEVYWVIVTTVGNNVAGWDEERLQKREQEIEDVKKVYGFTGVLRMDFNTIELDTIPVSALVTRFSEIFSELKPDTIYLPNRSDVHTDHFAVFRAAYSCTKSFRYPFIKRILMYETVSETEFAAPLQENIFVPNVFVDITPYFKQKLDIFKIFRYEVMDKPYPRSISTIEALARFRGSRIGAEYAEAFQLLYEHR